MWTADSVFTRPEPLFPECWQNGPGRTSEFPEIPKKFSDFLTAVPYIFEIVIFVLLFELALIVFLLCWTN